MFKKSIGLLLVVWLAAGCATNATPAASNPSNALALTPPWTADEHFEYNLVSSQNGSPIGSSTITIRLAPETTTFEEQDQLGKITQHDVVKVNPRSLKPISNEKQVTGSPNDFSLTATYQSGKLTVAAQTAQGDKNATVDVAVDAIENDSVLMALRGAPLTESYSAVFPIVVSANAAQIKTTVTVTGKESISVPAGSFETYKVEMTFGGAQKQTLWYEVAAPHRLIQYDNGATKFVLAKSS